MFCNVEPSIPCDLFLLIEFVWFIMRSCSLMILFSFLEFVFIIEFSLRFLVFIGFGHIYLVSVFASC